MALHHPVGDPNSRCCGGRLSSCLRLLGAQLDAEVADDEAEHDTERDDQHDRGREITEYVRTVTGKGTIGDAEAMARALETLVVMYENHAAREDTIVFPAWKAGLSDKQLREMSETFEDIEHRQFGKDGFDDALKQVAAVEETFGVADLAQFTAPAPPRPT